ncbi:site-specific recombinase XerD [Flavobacterium sp. 9]|nr:site-specific recombinase XerD [Flavobacterium sp. 9]
MNFNGKLTAKIVIKDDYVRTDGTSTLYLQIFVSGQKKKIPLHIAVKPIYFDKVKQRVKSKDIFHKDYNLIIEKSLADLNKIEIKYRLENENLTMDKLLHEYQNPSSRIDFIKFWEMEMENQKLIRDNATVQQQLSTLRKVKGYQNSILFYEITKDFYEKMIFHFEKVEKNAPHTIQTLAKNFKKYLHIANELGVKTPLKYQDIKMPKCVSNRAFLLPDEVFKLYEYYNSQFINESLKNILARFLFSCFTGLRISDIRAISLENVVNDILIFFAQKTGKLQRIQLSESALKFIGNDKLFYGEYTDQHINRELKQIVKACGIKKNVTFHVSRHSFATNFLICGGRVEDLQKLLGHSEIKETMVYVHIVESITDKQIHNMNDILTKKPLN